MRDTPLAALKSLFVCSDEQAMWRVQTHDDEAAFATLVRRWEGTIQRLCTRMLGDAHRGQDAAQETFSRLFARRKDYQADGKFSSFLWRVAMNLCYDELRRRKRRAEESLDAEPDGALAPIALLEDDEPHPDARLAANEQAEMVRRALLQLPEVYRSVVVLRHYEDLKFREIAEVLEIPEGTVKSRMAEALTLLERLLKREMGHTPKPGSGPRWNPNETILI
ncbi:MAG TPA: sigma-70 family RNA polymerase sigma factor [Verrucomicrobiae bacterium]|nr:sigma-70 family RNA polymerase sigma factor [Verrucomicrobiae bacterium]